MKKTFCKMCVTLCGRFCPDEGAVSGYGNRIRMKYTIKWGVQIMGMIFQTGSRAFFQMSSGISVICNGCGFTVVIVPLGILLLDLVQTVLNIWDFAGYICHQKVQKCHRGTVEVEN